MSKNRKLQPWIRTLGLFMVLSVAAGGPASVKAQEGGNWRPEPGCG